MARDARQRLFGRLARGLPEVSLAVTDRAGVPFAEEWEASRPGPGQIATLGYMLSIKEADGSVSPGFSSGHFFGLGDANDLNEDWVFACRTGCSPLYVQRRPNWGVKRKFIVDLASERHCIFSVEPS